MMNEIDETALASLVRRHGLGDVRLALARLERKPKIDAAIRQMVDMSTAHLTRNDTELLKRTVDPIVRVTSHEYGWIIFVSADELTERIARLKAEGFSAGFVAIYQHAAERADVMLINFDGAAGRYAGYPTHNW